MTISLRQEIGERPNRSLIEPKETSTDPSCTRLPERVDKISQLPTEVISHLFSYIPQECRGLRRPANSLLEFRTVSRKWDVAVTYTIQGHINEEMENIGFHDLGIPRALFSKIFDCKLNDSILDVHPKDLRARLRHLVRSIDEPESSIFPWFHRHKDFTTNKLPYTLLRLCIKQHQKPTNRPHNPDFYLSHLLSGLSPGLDDTDCDHLQVCLVKRNRPLLDFVANREIHNNKQLILIALEEGKVTLHALSAQYREDRECILAAVVQNPDVILSASPQLCDDEAFILDAILKNPTIIRFASDRLRKKKNIVLAAILKNPAVILLASPQLCDDEAFILDAILKNPSIIRFASDRLRKKEDIISAACKLDPNALNDPNDRRGRFIFANGPIYAGEVVNGVLVNRVVYTPQ